MRFTTSAFLFGLFASATAHFTLQYPLPRGEFVEDDEPNFCGGYTEVTTNRTTFPLSGGFFTIKTGHAGFTVGALLSTVADPNNFDNFSVNGVEQFAYPYAEEANAGTFCMPLNISAAGIDGVKDGANVTLQIVFAGGDGNLYQCADLTLSANLATVTDATCSNSSTTTSSTASSAAASETSTTTASLGVTHQASAAAAFLIGIVGVTAALL